SVSEFFYSSFFKTFRNLKEVLISNSSSIKDSDINQLIQHSRHSLKLLDISLCTELRSITVSNVLSSCPNLITLDAHGIDFNPKDLKQELDKEEEEEYEIEENRINEMDRIYNEDGEVIVMKGEREIQTFGKLDSNTEPLLL